MFLSEFATQTLGGKTYGNPPPLLIPYSGTFVGQCVSYARQYMEAVHFVPTGRWGNAKDYWNNPNVLKYYDQTQTKGEGYIAVYDASYGNGNGHIGVVYQGKLLSQNFSKALVVTQDNFPTKGLLGFLKFKGVADMHPYNSGDAHNIAIDMGQPEREAELKTKKDWNDAYYAAIAPRLRQLVQQAAHPYNKGDAHNLAVAMGQPEREAELATKLDWNDVAYAVLIPRFNELVPLATGYVCTKEEREYLDSLYKITKGITTYDSTT